MPGVCPGGGGGMLMFRIDRRISEVNVVYKLYATCTSLLNLKFQIRKLFLVLIKVICEVTVFDLTTEMSLPVDLLIV